ncbi:MAG: hypothetical protein AAF205_00265 [Pseudomonadota bacterium]
MKDALLIYWNMLRVALCFVLVALLYVAYVACVFFAVAFTLDALGFGANLFTVIVGFTIIGGIIVTGEKYEVRAMIRGVVDFVFGPDKEKN